MTIALLLFVLYLLFVFHKPYLQLLQVDGQRYMTRWRLISTKWFRIYLHRLDGPDPDRDCHNHPWDATVIVLRKPGKYIQHTIRYTNSSYEREEVVGRINHLGSFYHRIVAIAPGTWTLTIAGPVKREWGFLVGNKHINWKPYVETIQQNIMKVKGTDAKYKDHH